MTPEHVIAQKIKENGTTIRFVSERTGIPYSRLQPSLSGYRELRADEFIKLCVFLGINPIN